MLAQPADEIRSGSDSRRNWRHINANSTAISELERELRPIREAFAREPRLYRNTRLPFEVYLRPPYARSSEDQSADAWREFTVRHGYVNYVSTEGCDDADGEGTTAELITVPEATERYVIYVEATLADGAVSAAEVKHGAADWTDWPAAVSEDGTKFRRLLAVVDTLSSGRKEARVRQWQRGDVFADGVGADGRWS